jgi:hypothetical protein
MVKRSLALCLLLLALTGGLGTPESLAQTPTEPDTSAVEPEAEATLEALDEESGDGEQLVELLTALADEPLELNTAPVEELAQIPAFGPLLAARIVAWRTQNGPFRSIPEVRAVPGVTEVVFLAARPYLRIGEALGPSQQPRRFAPWPRPGEVLRTARTEVIQRYIRRLNLGRGYDGDTTGSFYAGSPERLYTRLQVRTPKRLSLNLTLEKDPGEVFTWDPSASSYGYDFASTHLALFNAGRIKTLVVGDYTASFGQGLALWRSIGTGKGRETVRPLARIGTGIVPYSSTDENQFFRGAATTVLVTPSLAASAFASRRTLDASVHLADTTGEDGQDERLFEEAVTTLSTSGLHRTPNERAQKDAATETLLGGGLSWTHRRTVVGLAGYRSTFTEPFQSDPAPYRRFAFTGTEATMLSLYSHTFVGNYLLFGELARGPGNTVATLGGATLRLGRAAEAVVLARHYPKDFNSLHGYGFGERAGTTQNESGLYAGVWLHPDRTWTLAAYFDQYRFPWLRFSVPRPTSGYDALVLIEHHPRAWLTAYLQARTETKEAGFTAQAPGGPALDAVTPETRQSLRLHTDYRFTRALRVRARLEAVRFRRPDMPDAYGVLLFQDLRWLPYPAVQIDLRYALFDTDSFDARVFAYENDLRYTFSVPSFSGRGQRWYALLYLTPHPRTVVEAKYAVTRFEDVTSVGSGLDEADGNLVREIRLQLRIRL